MERKEPSCGISGFGPRFTRDFGDVLCKRSGGSD